MTGPATPASECTHCGEEILPGDDFCRECGHSAGPPVDPVDLLYSEDNNAGDICPRCGATHLVIVAQGHPQCETCGFTDRD